MTDGGIALEATTIVVRGAFNPAIFTPAWFKGQNLIGDLEIEEQDVEIITRDIAVFNMGWLRCHVTGEAMQLSATAPDEYQRLRDAAIGVLRLLSHTPISALGINREFHSRISSVEDWHAIGDAIAPKAIWEGTLEVPGMRSAILWGVRPDAYAGQIQIQVEPSQRFPQSVYVATNDHFTLTLASKKIESRTDTWELSDPSPDANADKIEVAIQVLLDEWDAAMARSEKSRSTVVGLADRK